MVSPALVVRTVLKPLAEGQVRHREPRGSELGRSAGQELRPAPGAHPSKIASKPLFCPGLSSYPTTTGPRVYRDRRAAHLRPASGDLTEVRLHGTSRHQRPSFKADRGRGHAARPRSSSHLKASRRSP
jgi:hypothetical protein